MVEACHFFSEKLMKFICIFCREILSTNPWKTLTCNLNNIFKIIAKVISDAGPVSWSRLTSVVT
jgi:hypothetical protein